MSAAASQRTLKGPIRLSGVGLHSGVHCIAELSPLGENQGIRFKVSGSAGSTPAHLDALHTTTRCTQLQCGDHTVMTVEHLLSALSGCEVDNCLITVSGPEIPALDGSAAPFVAALQAIGLAQQNAARRYLELQEPVWIEENGSTLLAVPSPDLRIRFGIHFPGTPINHQVYACEVNLETYASQIAPARTFGLMSEVEELQRRGLALGGSLENTVIVGDDGYHTVLRFPDEPVRHKVLDLIGDLSLLGAPLRAEVTALKSSHRLNALLAQSILRTRRA